MDFQPSSSQKNDIFDIGLDVQSGVPLFLCILCTVPFRGDGFRINFLGSEGGGKSPFTLINGAILLKPAYDIDDASLQIDYLYLSLVSASDRMLNVSCDVINLVY